jgi:hypothetical protein
MTSVFASDRYFDVFVTYAKAAPRDLLIEINVYNRGPETASLHVLPSLWFRNTWSWGVAEKQPHLRQVSPGLVEAYHPSLGSYWLACRGIPPLLFTDNESNAQRLSGVPNRSEFVKDGIDAFVVGGRVDAVNPEQFGTKMSADTSFTWHPVVRSGSACACQPRRLPCSTASLTRSSNNVNVRLTSSTPRFSRTR